MEMLVWGLVIAAILFLVWKYGAGLGLFGGTNASNGGKSSANPYGSNTVKSIQSVVQSGIKAIDGTVSNTAKQLGGLAAKVESATLHGSAKTFEGAHPSSNTAKSYKTAASSQLYSGVGSGLGFITGPAATAGAAAGSAIPSFFGGLLQGGYSGVQAAKSLPVQKAINAYVNKPIDHFFTSRASDVAHWIGHVL